MPAVWTTIPLVGVGPLRFGMSRDDVARLESDLGAVCAEFTEAGADGKPIIQQARDREAPVLFFKEGGLSGIQLDHHSRFDVRFGDVSVFGGHSRDVLAALENANGGARFGLGAVLFAGLAVSMNGFFAGADPQGAPVFWDDLPDRPRQSRESGNEGRIRPVPSEPRGNQLQRIG